MYLSETEVYQRFYKAVKKVIDRPDPLPFDEDYEADVYSKNSEIEGMIRLVEELTKEEEK